MYNVLRVTTMWIRFIRLEQLIIIIIRSRVIIKCYTTYYRIQITSDITQHYRLEARQWLMEHQSAPIREKHHHLPWTSRVMSTDVLPASFSATHVNIPASSALRTAIIASQKLNRVKQCVYIYRETYRQTNRQTDRGREVDKKIRLKRSIRTISS